MANILEKYADKLHADAFNNPSKQGYLTINGYGFDIRIVNDLIYCAGVRLPDFMYDLDLTDKEDDEYLTVIQQWIMQP